MSEIDRADERWYQRAVFYEVSVRSFFDANGDGNGDLATGFVHGANNDQVGTAAAPLDPKFDPDAVSKGITPGAFEDYPLDLWNSALNVNLTGMFLMTQACVKPMIAQGRKGSIINNLSLSVQTGGQGTGPYVASKGALQALTRTLARELAPRNVRVNAVSPGPIETGFFERTGMPAAAVAEFGAAVTAQVPLGRFGKPEEVARVREAFEAYDPPFLIEKQVLGATARRLILWYKYRPELVRGLSHTRLAFKLLGRDTVITDRAQGGALTIRVLARGGAALQEFLREINGEISQLLGIDFASFAKHATC